MMNVTYGKGFDIALPKMMRQKVDALQHQLAKMPQYEPETTHYFHGGMYCRQVFRHAGVLVVGAVHKKEHFYFVASGTVAITDGEGNVEEVTGPHLFLSKPGTKRAVYALTDVLCMTFHVTDAKTVTDAEAKLVEADPNSMYSLGNQAKHKEIEVQS
jgi:hypothetical protein